jgi:hypothetical protein
MLCLPFLLFAGLPDAFLRPNIGFFRCERQAFATIPHCPAAGVIPPGSPHGDPARSPRSNVCKILYAMEKEGGLSNYFMK